MERLREKRCIVTGAGRGIGRAISERFLHEGARVLLCDIVGERLADTAEDLKALGDVHSVVGDISDKKFCRQLIDEAEDHFGGVDVLANNAGTGVFAPFLEHTVEDWDRTFSVNLRGMFLLSQEAARLMVRQEHGGAIINMASTNAHLGERDLAAYNASKAGVLLLTKTMAIELAKHKIRVNSVSPGFIATELATEAGGDPEFLRKYSSKIPLGRVGRPEEVATVFVFLASKESSFITGETIVVDGGQISQE